jgi:uncharacterized membrane protein
LRPANACGPIVTGKPRRVYSFAEAVNAAGLAIRQGDRPLSWGGATILCTRNAKFELSDHRDCAGNGLNSAGFAGIELDGRGGTTVRFK